MSRKRNFDEVNLNVTCEEVNAILCADEYALRIDKYGCQDVPDKLKNKCYGDGAKRKGINWRNASDILLHWETDGIPTRASNYLFWNHPEMMTFLQHRNIIIHRHISQSRQGPVFEGFNATHADDGSDSSSHDNAESTSDDTSDSDSENTDSAPWSEDESPIVNIATEENGKSLHILTESFNLLMYRCFNQYEPSFLT